MSEAAQQEFELLVAISGGSHSETTAIAMSSMRLWKAVHDWMNTSLLLMLNNEEITREPEVTNDAVENQNNKIAKRFFPKNCRTNYIRTNENSQWLNPYYTPPENVLAAANEQAFSQKHLQAQVNEKGQQGLPSPRLTNQAIADSHPPYVHVRGASLPHIQQPVLPEPFESQVNQNIYSEFFHHALL